MAIGINKVIKEFEKGNVCVVGMRGTGKDMLFANVIARRKLPYISNTNYKLKNCPYMKLDFNAINVKNTYDNFINGDIVPYDYPYEDGIDTYLADGGVYLPSQYCNELNKKYPHLSVYYALTRHLGVCNFHINVQNLNRIYDKIREQSDTYITCNKCSVLKGKIPIIGRLFKNIVIQQVTIYDKYQSCVDRVEPYKNVNIPFFANKQLKANLQQVNEESRRRYRESYGKVKKVLLIYKNKSDYDTRLFKSLLEGKK